MTLQPLDDEVLSQARPERQIVGRDSWWTVPRIVAITGLVVSVTGLVAALTGLLAEASVFVLALFAG